MKKGIVIVMSMVVKKVALKSNFARRQRNACPRCYETHVGVMPDDGWLRWYIYDPNPYFLVRPLTLTTIAVADVQNGFLVGNVHSRFHDLSRKERVLQTSAICMWNLSKEYVNSVNEYQLEVTSNHIPISVPRGYVALSIVD